METGDSNEGRTRVKLLKAKDMPEAAEDHRRLDQHVEAWSHRHLGLGFPASN